MGSKKRANAATVAASYGVGGLTRHVFICIGPDCVDKDDGERVWKYLKKRLNELDLTGTSGTCYRTRCSCLRVCTGGPICVVYPEGAWYGDVTEENAERIIQQHLLRGKIVKDLCFARNPLKPPR